MEKAAKHVSVALIWSALVALLLVQATVVSARIGGPGSVPLLEAALKMPGIGTDDSLDAVRQSIRLPGAAPEQASEQPRAAVTRAARTGRGADTSMFAGLGVWIDLYDMALDPRIAVAVMKAQGVRTLYIQTARYNTMRYIDDAVWPWVIAAHESGIAVVGWYLPGYANMENDFRRTMAIANAQHRGHRFDALGIDIEWRRSVRNLTEWNARVQRLQEQVKDALPDYPVAAITPSPLQMRVAPGHWEGFPWRALAENSDVLMTMSYWSARAGCPRVGLHCPYQYTKNDIYIARRLTGNIVPVHIIGGVGDRITVSEVADFVRGAQDAKAYGASLYDFDTTLAAYWAYLTRLAGLVPGAA